MVTIRAATDADFAAVAAVHLSAWQAAYRGLVPPAVLDAIDPGDWVAGRRRWWRPEAVLVAADPAVLGFVSYGPDQSDPAYDQIYALYVAPERWRGGVGRALLTAALARLDAAATGEGRDVRVWCAADNPPARRCYEALGFVADGAEDSHDLVGTAVPTVRYTRERAS